MLNPTSHIVPFDSLVASLVCLVDNKQNPTGMYLAEPFTSFLWLSLDHMRRSRQQNVKWQPKFEMAVFETCLEIVVCPHYWMYVFFVYANASDNYLRTTLTSQPTTSIETPDDILIAKSS
jgi:hypothetical protein